MLALKDERRISLWETDRKTSVSHPLHQNYAILRYAQKKPPSCPRSHPAKVSPDDFSLRQPLPADTMVSKHPKRTRGCRGGKKVQAAKARAAVREAREAAKAAEQAATHARSLNPNLSPIPNQPGSTKNSLTSPSRKGAPIQKTIAFVDYPSKRPAPSQKLSSTPTIPRRPGTPQKTHPVLNSPSWKTQTAHKRNAVTFVHSPQQKKHNQPAKAASIVPSPSSRKKISPSDDYVTISKKYKPTEKRFPGAKNQNKR